MTYSASLSPVLKATALSTLLTTGLASAAPWTDTYSEKTTEYSLPSSVELVQDSTLPLRMDINFVDRWRQASPSRNARENLHEWDSQKRLTHLRNQRIIGDSLASAQKQLNEMTETAKSDNVILKSGREQAQEKYGEFAVECSWGDLAAGITGFYGLLNAIGGNPGAAVVSLGCSMGIHFISTAIKEIQMDHLEKVLKNKNVATSARKNQTAFDPLQLQEAERTIQQARAAAYHNIALLHGGDWLKDRDIKKQVSSLTSDSRYRHMQLPVSFNKDDFASHLYGVLSSQINDDVFILVVGNNSGQISTQNTYKLLRSDGRYYVAINNVALTGQPGTEFMAFDTPRQALGFFEDLTIPHQAQEVGFINLDPQSSVAR